MRKLYETSVFLQLFLPHMKYEMLSEAWGVWISFGSFLQPVPCTRNQLYPVNWVEEATSKIKKPPFKTDDGHFYKIIMFFLCFYDIHKINVKNHDCFPYKILLESTCYVTQRLGRYKFITAFLSEVCADCGLNQVKSYNQKLIFESMMSVRRDDTQHCS